MAHRSRGTEASRPSEQTGGLGCPRGTRVCCESGPDSRAGVATGPRAQTGAGEGLPVLACGSLIRARAPIVCAFLGVPLTLFQKQADSKGKAGRQGQPRARADRPAFCGPGSLWLCPGRELCREGVEVRGEGTINTLKHKHSRMSPGMLPGPPLLEHLAGAGPRPTRTG